MNKAGIVSCNFSGEEEKSRGAGTESPEKSNNTTVHIAYQNRKTSIFNSEVNLL